MFFYVFILMVLLQRLVELRLAKKNRQWAMTQGGIEVGKEHYRWIWLLHATFFVALLVEYGWVQPTMTHWAVVPFVLFVLAQGLRTWVIASLGRYWNTRIIVIPHATLVPKGPYRYIRHPNYVAVVIEIATIPLLFQLYITAIVFTLMNAVVLVHRIRIEESSLLQHTSYAEAMQQRPRMLPWGRR